MDALKNSTSILIRLIGIMTMKRMSYNLSVGEPCPAVGIDIGRWCGCCATTKTLQEVVGLTVIGLRAKLAKAA